MALVRLCGGLGNQMFQYAAALNLAQKHQSILKVDVSWYFLDHRAIGCTSRRYELDQFEGVQVEQVKIPRIYSQIMAIIRRCHVLRDSVFCQQRLMFEDTSFRYDPKFEKLKDDAILDGYFQAMGYLEPIAPMLRQIFVPKFNTDELFRSILMKAERENTVAIHIRRGDYISNSDAAAIHVVQEPNYYRNAIEVLTQKFGPTQRLFFSDDLRWCRETFTDLDGSVFVDTQHLNSAQALYLMSRCNHQVIANSSFSWWAGWLNVKSGKCVIMPQKWIKDRATEDTGLVYNGCIIV